MKLRITCNWCIRANYWLYLVRKNVLARIVYKRGKGHTRFDWHWHGERQTRLNRLLNLWLVSELHSGWQKDSWIPIFTNLNSKWNRGNTGIVYYKTMNRYKIDFRKMSFRESDYLFDDKHYLALQWQCIWWSFEMLFCIARYPCASLSCSHSLCFSYCWLKSFRQHHWLCLFSENIFSSPWCWSHCPSL